MSPKNSKNSIFRTLDPPKLISHKISMIEKSWNFHTVLSRLGALYQKCVSSTSNDENIKTSEIVEIHATFVLSSASMCISLIYVVDGAYKNHFFKEIPIDLIIHLGKIRKYQEG